MTSGDVTGQGGPHLKPAVPILFVTDVAVTATWFARIGFVTDWLHGEPSFYGSVSRKQASLHLRLVGQPNFVDLAAVESSLIIATIEVDDVRTLFDEIAATGIGFAQQLEHQTWGGLDFQVRDPDGNTISFFQYL